jgi:hypothetical protein
MICSLFKIKFRNPIFALVLFSSIQSFSQPTAHPSGKKDDMAVRHFLFLGMDRELLQKDSFWKPELFDGVQIAYSWSQLEPSKDEYDFSLIEDDLKYLKKSGRKLFIQIQDVTFSFRWKLIPQYILNDTDYHGGADKHYKFKDGAETDPVELGLVTRRWDKAVQVRLHKLYTELGKKFDGKVEGINTEETAVDFGPGPLHPPGFTYTKYRDAINENMFALKKAFPKSTVIVYANFMPGGFIPGGDSSLLKSVYEYAWANKIGVGGPDLLPWQKYQMTNSYPFIQRSYGKVKTSLAVQDGTGDYINPKSLKPVTADEIYSFGKDYLKLSYVFWGAEDPFYHNQTLPLLERLRH